MSGGTLVWLTDNELELLDEWYRAAAADSGPALPEDTKLRDKLEAVREEVACRVPRSSR
jgi:hypothetical protein